MARPQLSVKDVLQLFSRVTGEKHFHLMPSGPIPDTERWEWLVRSVKAIFTAQGRTIGRGWGYCVVSKHPELALSPLARKLFQRLRCELKGLGDWWRPAVAGPYKPAMRRLLT